MVRRVASIVAVFGVTACAPARHAPPVAAFAPTPLVAFANDVPLRDVPCPTCSTTPLGPEVTNALEKRLVDLKARGGDCASYAAVLETSYRSGQITIRPYMWRVGSHLASGEAKPNGEMILARDIDSLNVGVRTVDDLVRTMEHEAAHITFKTSSGTEPTESRTNEYVKACVTAGSPVEGHGSR